jgi:DNA topoisomerase VI subunit B
MVIDKNYFLGRLANGEDMDVIGQEIADMMTEALNEHNTNLEAEAKRQAEVEKEQTKRDLLEELVEIVQELAILEGMDPEDLEMTDEDMDQLVAAFTEMFAAMRDLKKLFTSIDAPKTRKATINIKPTDDQILADFLKMFN